MITSSDKSLLITCLSLRVPASGAMVKPVFLTLVISLRSDWSRVPGRREGSERAVQSF